MPVPVIIATRRNYLHTLSRAIAIGTELPLSNKTAKFTSIVRRKHLKQSICKCFSKPNGFVPPLNGPEKYLWKTLSLMKLMYENFWRNSIPTRQLVRMVSLQNFWKKWVMRFGLTLFMQSLLHPSEVPADWRHATVAPVFKSGKSDKVKAENYRPISLTSISCKIMEHIVHSNIIFHLDNTGMLSDTQHRFRQRRSCESQLVLTIHDLALNDGHQIDSVLLDFSKTLDKVDHFKLCLKLDHYGVQGTSLN